MTIAIDLCTEIPATPSIVWAAIERIETHTTWMADAESITFVGSQHEGVGTEFACLTVVGPLHTRDRMRVTEWEPGKVMGIEHRGAVSGTGRFTLTPSARGTEFCWREQLTFPWWMGGALGERAGKPVLMHVWRRNLERLRHHVVGSSAKVC